MGTGAYRVMIVGGNFHGRGAEAMMLTVRDVCTASFPEVECYVLTFHDRQNHMYENERLHPVRMRPLRRPLSAVGTVVRRLGLSGRRGVDLSKASTAGLINPYGLTNAVIDISGFATGDQWGAKAALMRWQTAVEIRRAGNKLIYMPQSWGPFADRQVGKYARRMCNQADLVFAREKLSYDSLMALEAIDTHRIHLAPDIGFQFRPAPEEEASEILACHCLREDGEPVVALTPNMRIYERQEGKGRRNAYVHVFADIVQWFQHELGARVVLIPHEIWGDRPDDVRLCQFLLQEAPYADRICMLSSGTTAAQIKAIIGQADFLVASRYHSLVAAFSMRVPVAVVGWSHKYDELMETAQLRDWCADPVRRDSEGVLHMIRRAWDRRDEIRASLQAALPKLEDQSRRSLQMMVEQILE